MTAAQPFAAYPPNGAQIWITPGATFAGEPRALVEPGYLRAIWAAQRRQAPALQIGPQLELLAEATS